MDRYDITQDELQGILAQLEQALFYHHQQWHAAMIRELTCQVPGGQHDLSSEAHHACHFGQWYCDKISEKLRELPGFIALGKAHEHMHQLAAKLLIEAQEENSANAVDGNFANALDRMRLEITALERPCDKEFCCSGKEFPLLMLHTASASCHDIEERLREGLALMSMDFDEKAQHQIATSFGAVLRLFMHQA